MNDHIKGHKTMNCQKSKKHKYPCTACRVRGHCEKRVIVEGGPVKGTYVWPINTGTEDQGLTDESKIGGM